MKRKIIIFGALALLLLVIVFIAWDLFFNKPAGNENPYAYDLKSLRSGDSTQILFAEEQHFSTGLPAIHGIALDKSDHIFIAGENGFEIYDPAGKREAAIPIGEQPIAFMWTRPDKYTLACRIMSKFTIRKAGS